MRALAVLLSIVFLATIALANASLCAGALGAPSKHEIEVNLAHAAGLHYAEKAGPGYTRQSDGQRGFRYFAADGSVVTDPATLSRINALKIPPAWDRVWVAVDPLEHVQARGSDARKRLQSRYHPLWETGVKETAKFERMERFGRVLPQLRAAVAIDLAKAPVEKDARLAAVTRLLEVAGIRIGGEKYAQENEHYGLTTLQVRHASLARKDRVVLHFVGKEGVEHDVAVTDPLLARLVATLASGKAADELLFDVSASNVNDYIKSHTGPDFSAKDFRTWVGTTTAAKVLGEAGHPADEGAAQKAEKAAAIAASERLRNEPATAREHYIAPFIFEAYRSGKLEQIYRELKPSDRPAEEQAVLLLVPGN